jgi:hypothetical protein
LLKSKLKALLQLAGNSIQDLRKAKVKKTFALEKFKKLAGSDPSTCEDDTFNVLPSTQSLKVFI